MNFGLIHVSHLYPLLLSMDWGTEHPSFVWDVHNPGFFFSTTEKDPWSKNNSDSPGVDSKTDDSVSPKSSRRQAALRRFFPCFGRSAVIFFALLTTSPYLRMPSVWTTRNSAGASFIFLECVNNACACDRTNLFQCSFTSMVYINSDEGGVYHCCFKIINHLLKYSAFN